MIRYKILPMRRAEVVSEQLDPERHAVISITDPGEPDRKFTTKNVLRLSFEDDQTSFTVDDAERILEWRESIDEEIVEIIIAHCVAGRCRSAGVVAALLVTEGREDFSVFKVATPNMHVYRTILNTHYKRTTDDTGWIPYYEDPEG